MSQNHSVLIVCTMYYIKLRSTNMYIKVLNINLIKLFLKGYFKEKNEHYSLILKLKLFYSFFNNQ